MTSTTVGYLVVELTSTVMVATSSTFLVFLVLTSILYCSTKLVTAFSILVISATSFLITVLVLFNFSMVLIISGCSWIVTVSNTISFGFDGTTGSENSWTSISLIGVGFSGSYVNLTYFTLLFWSTVTTVYCFSSTDVLIVLMSSVLKGVTLMTSLMAGLALGTTFSMYSILLEVTILVPSSVVVCWRTTGYLSSTLGRGEAETYSVFPVFTLVTTV